MIRSRIAQVGCGLALATASLASADDERFRLVSASPQRLEARLDEQASKGYRMIAAGAGSTLDGRERVVALVERHDGGPKDYRVLSTAGDMGASEVVEQLETLAADGFRLARDGVLIRKLDDFWLPESRYEDRMTLVFEASSGGPYRYAGIGFGDPLTFRTRIAEALSTGGEVLGLWNTGRQLQAIVEWTPSSQPAPVAVDDVLVRLDPTRMLYMNRLDAAVKRGFRIVGADDPSVTGPPITLLLRSDDAALVYELMDDMPRRLYRDKFRNKLNKRARRGWRVTRQARTAEVTLMERYRDPERIKDPKGRERYLMLSSSEPPGLPRALEVSTLQGFEVIRLFVEPEETTVLLERWRDEAPPELDSPTR